MRIQHLPFIFVVLVSGGCDSQPTDNSDDRIPRLVLSADRLTGNSPLEVRFVGTFEGRIDTIQMKTPPFQMFSGFRNERVRSIEYGPNLLPSQRYYNSSETYDPGTYRAFMWLYSKNRQFHSDTLTIICYYLVAP